LRQLRSGDALDDVALGTGWESHSGFRDAFTRTFGAAPGAARTQPDAAVIVSTIDTPLGPMVAGATAEGLCLLEFTDRRMLEAQMRRLQSLLKQPLLPGDSPYVAQAREELARY